MKLLPRNTVLQCSTDPCPTGTMYQGCPSSESWLIWVNEQSFLNGLFCGLRFWRTNYISLSERWIRLPWITKPTFQKVDSRPEKPSSECENYNKHFVNMLICNVWKQTYIRTFQTVDPFWKRHSVLAAEEIMIDSFISWILDQRNEYPTSNFDDRSWKLVAL